jgi:F0F1-type ATP synthase membrane subunit b/b'
MSTQEPGRSPGSPSLAALPRVEDLPTNAEGGYDADKVREAFDTFRRHAAQVQAQLRVMQAAGRTAHLDPTGHSVRMDSLHLIRAAAEFADTLERDAQNASAAQLARTEEEVRRRQNELQQREAEIERFQQESERQRAEILNAAKTEARELLASANRDSTGELQEAETKAARLLEQSRHQATELTNATRAEVEQTLEWARAQAAAILARAQQGAQQYLRAAGLGQNALDEVSQAIIGAAEQSMEASRQQTPVSRPAVPAPLAPAPEPEADSDQEPEQPAFGEPPPAPVAAAPAPTSEQGAKESADAEESADGDGPQR